MLKTNKKSRQNIDFQPSATIRHWTPLVIIIIINFISAQCKRFLLFFQFLVLRRFLWFSRCLAIAFYLFFRHNKDGFFSVAGFFLHFTYIYHFRFHTLFTFRFRRASVYVFSIFLFSLLLVSFVLIFVENFAPPLMHTILFWRNVLSKYWILPSRQGAKYIEPWCLPFQDRWYQWRWCFSQIPTSQRFKAQKMVCDKIFSFKQHAVFGIWYTHGPWAMCLTNEQLVLLVDAGWCCVALAKTKQTKMKRTQCYKFDSKIFRINIVHL